VDQRRSAEDWPFVASTMRSHAACVDRARPSTVNGSAAGDPTARDAGACWGTGALAARRVDYHRRDNRRDRCCGSFRKKSHRAWSPTRILGWRPGRARSADKLPGAGDAGYGA
jgi:hypothetical protein